MVKEKAADRSPPSSPVTPPSDRHLCEGRSSCEERRARLSPKAPPPPPPPTPAAAPAPARAFGRHHALRRVDEGCLGGRAARLLDPHQRALADSGAAEDRHDVAVELRHRVILVVHVRLLDHDQHLLALAKRQRSLLDLLTRSLEHHLEVSIGSASVPSNR